MNWIPKACLHFPASIVLSEAIWVFRCVFQPSEGFSATSHVLDRQEGLNSIASPPMVAQETCRKGMGRKVWRFGRGWRDRCSLCCGAERGTVPGFNDYECSRGRAPGMSVSHLVPVRNELLETWCPGDLGSVENHTLTVQVIAPREVRGVRIPNLYRQTNYVFSCFAVFPPLIFLLACGFDAKLMKKWTKGHF